MPAEKWNHKQDLLCHDAELDGQPSEHRGNVHRALVICSKDHRAIFWNILRSMQMHTNAHSCERESRPVLREVMRGATGAIDEGYDTGEEAHDDRGDHENRNENFATHLGAKSADRLCDLLRCRNRIGSSNNGTADHKVISACLQGSLG